MKELFHTSNPSDFDSAHTTVQLLASGRVKVKLAGLTLVLSPQEAIEAVAGLRMTQYSLDNIHCLRSYALDMEELANAIQGEIA